MLLFCGLSFDYADMLVFVGILIGCFFPTFHILSRFLTMQGSKVLTCGRVGLFFYMGHQGWKGMLGNFQVENMCQLLHLDWSKVYVSTGMDVDCLVGLKFFKSKRSDS